MSQNSNTVEMDRVCKRIASEALYSIDNIAHVERMDILLNSVRMAHGVGFNRGMDSVMRGAQKRVIQMDLKGNRLREFKSFVDAQRKTGISKVSIGKAVRKYRNHKTAGGFKWKLADNN